MFPRLAGALVTVVAITACSARDGTSQGDDPSQMVDAPGGAARSGARGAAASSPCTTTGAQGIWASDFVPQQYANGVQDFGFVVYPSEPSRAPIDAVMGLANGPASSFTALGPIVRFNPAGFIDARDGDTYRADTVVPYATDGATEYLVELNVDFATHTYSPEVYAGSEGPIALGTSYHFRGEQAAMTRADNFVREVDSPTGSVRTCYPGGSWNWHTSTAGSGWSTTPFRPESGVIHVEVEAYPNDANLDAVVGLAAAAPSGFTDLAAIGRFSPTGVIDARDGGTYRADTTYPYRAYGDYRFIFDVDVPAGTYTLTVLDEGDGTRTVIARDYAFRTEQAGVQTLAALGQFVDGSVGTFTTARLFEIY